MLKNRVNGGVPEPECGIVTYPKKERKQRRPRSYHFYNLVHNMCNLVSCFACCSGHLLENTLSKLAEVGFFPTELHLINSDVIACKILMSLDLSI